MLLALCDCCHLGLNRPLFLDYIRLPVNVWLTYYKSLLGEFYFDLDFLRFPMVHYHPYHNFCGYSLFYCREFPIVHVLIYEVPFFPWIGLIAYLLLYFYFQNFLI